MEVIALQNPVRPLGRLPFYGSRAVKSFENRGALVQTPICRRLEEAMMTIITVEIEDAKAALLRERASRYGLRPEQLVTASIEDLLAQPEADFDAAAKRVVAKNKELYERLA